MRLDGDNEKGEIILTKSGYFEILQHLSPIAGDENVASLIKKIKILYNTDKNIGSSGGKKDVSKNIDQILRSNSSMTYKLKDNYTRRIKRLIGSSDKQATESKYGKQIMIGDKYLTKIQLRETHRVLLNIEPILEAKILLLQVAYNLMYITKIDDEETDFKIYEKTFNRIMKDDNNQRNNALGKQSSTLSREWQSTLYDLKKNKTI